VNALLQCKEEESDENANPPAYGLWLLVMMKVKVSVALDQG
jgi:hypothetical protein